MAFARKCFASCRWSLRWRRRNCWASALRGVSGKTSMNNQPILEIKDLNAGVEGKQILKGINLTMSAGELHAVMGPNGSGKSTLAAILAGREGYDISAGQVLYNSKDLLDMDPEERAREG